jgi:PBP1b-binding outer membrane lipoprotein LpoB
MKKSILSILSLVIMLFACSTPQNSVTNNNPPTTPPPPEYQVPKPVKPSSKYQKNKGGDQLSAPMEKTRAKAESVEMMRDTM